MTTQIPLESFVIKLKNKVFFKLVAYLLLITALILLIPVFQDESVVSETRIDKAQKALSEVNTRLYYADNFKNDILSRYKKYKDIGNPLLQSNYIYLAERLEELSGGHNFLEPVDIKISKPFFRKFNQIINTNQIVTKNYNIYLSFTAANFNDFVLKLKEIYKVLPQNSMIVSMEARQQEAITPEFISRLSANKDPNIVNAKVNVRISNIGLLWD